MSGWGASQQYLIVSHGCSDRWRPVEGDASPKLLTSAKHKNTNIHLLFYISWKIGLYLIPLNKPIYVSNIL